MSNIIEPIETSENSQHLTDLRRRADVVFTKRREIRDELEKVRAERKRGAAPQSSENDMEN